MTRPVLDKVTRATRTRDQAAENYRAAIVQARQDGATLHAIARAAGTSAPNILRIIRRATAVEDNETLHRAWNNRPIPPATDE